MTKDEVKEPTAIYDKSFTYGDYLNFEYEEMVELIKGKIFRMSPAPRIKHQVVCVNLITILKTTLINKQCKAFIAPIDVVLPVANKKKESAHTVVQPDIVVVCDPSIIEEQCIFGVPDFIIEILSPHTRKKDLQLKYEVYEESGVKEYWIVMPEEHLVEVFVLENGKYQRINTYTEEDEVACHTLPGLTLRLSDVFE
jgi:Uma2 family endonuclease